MLDILKVRAHSYSRQIADVRLLTVECSNAKIGFLFQKLDMELQRKVERAAGSTAKNRLLLTAYKPGLFGFED